nr:hypothetical protein [uncultured Arsenicibacter sp.]
MRTFPKAGRIIALILLFLTGINAVIAGYLFVIDPSGGQMGMSGAYLVHSPFSSYLIPGLILFFVNGVFNLVTGILTLRHYRLAPSLVFIQGILLTGWIGVQVAMVRDVNALHFIMTAIGILLMVCGWQMNTQKRMPDAKRAGH